MRKGAVIAGGTGQQIQHVSDALGGGGTRDPAALRSDDERHRGEARAAGGHQIVGRSSDRFTAIRRETAHRMRRFPKKAEGLPLHRFEQFLVGQ